MISSKELSGWALDYVRSRDAHFRRIQDIARRGDDFFVKFSDREVLYLIEPDMKADSLDKDKNYVLVTLNTKKNFDALIRVWPDLKAIRGLAVWFVNPNSANETKWMINPYIHSKICDDESLKTGLKAMFDTVDVI
ncbi:hypothetical protein JW968_07085 [Candidatus Woesearchaeota archaeon]|nr:hypothetical protein [Candidatus Woesearchaeota archaeon]